MSGFHSGYGFPIEGNVIKTYDDNIFGSIENGIYDAGNIIGKFFGNVSGSFSNSVGDAIGLPSFLIPSAILIVGSGAVVLFIIKMISHLLLIW